MVFAVTGGTQASGYEISNSLRFNKADSAKLSFTQGTPTSRRTWTYSTWVKRGNLADQQESILSWGDEDYFDVRFQDGSPDDGIIVYISDTDSKSLTTNRLFRDPSAFYHIVIASDTTQSTAGDRTRIYVNGVEETSFASEAQPDQNYDYRGLVSGDPIVIGNRYTGSHYLDGYLAETHFIDGQQLAPTEFGETNDNGVWIPKKYLGTYGTNGFKLEFKQTGTSQNSSGIGADTSGNDNHFAVSNLAAIDVTVDTPTNNFCTLNPLDPIQGAAYSEGNCKTVTNSSNRNYVTGTFGLTSGKWYWEAKLTAVTADAVDQAFFGIADLDDRGVDSTGQSLGDRANEVGWHQEEGKYQRNNSWSSAHTASWGIGDICAIALDADNNRVTIAKNGQWADGSGNADQSSPTAFVTYTASTMTPAMGEGGGGTEATWECNFGNSAFSISSGNADANGYGNFEYAVPSGYYALCTKNLAEYG